MNRSLPLSKNVHIERHYGTRHRAALGMSENTDALIIVVSEETGQLTAAIGGRFQHNLSVKEVRVLINQYLSNVDQDKDSLMAKAEKPVQKEKKKKDRDS